MKSMSTSSILSWDDIQTERQSFVFDEAPRRITFFNIGIVQYDEISIGLNPIHVSEAPFTQNPILLTQYLAESVIHYWNLL